MDFASSRRLLGHHRSLHQQELGAARGSSQSACVRFLTAACQLLLVFKKIEGSHTTEHVAHEIDQALNKLGDDVKSKLSALNADGAKNAQGAIKEFEDTWTLWCICHVLNLCVRAAFKVLQLIAVCTLTRVFQVVEKELGAVRAVGKATRKSTLGADDLKAAQSRVGVRKTQIALDVVTRWTSLLRWTVHRNRVAYCFVLLADL